uniref:Pre-mRNA-splicing factor Syf1/CRNKL1-like C-terminal HAT-repeats domain-containing protein n=1 Tax=Pyramimonas obovata TaxID=1411642 RepID=A0A7S0RPR7_9CHLO
MGNVAGARAVFERWMQWEPDHNGWKAYVRMELRYDEVERARAIFEKYMECHPTVKAWVHYAKFEARAGNRGLARRCYERAVEELGEDGQTEELFIKFAEFEEHSKETERARTIFKYALDHIPKSQATELYRRFVTFEKQHGDREGIEDVIVSKRRFQYEEEVKRNPLSYDSWFDYARLEETHGDHDKVREVYERAIANMPPATEKRYWQRYIYLWINYALFEELEAEDPARTREVYRECLKQIPHKQFSFSKVWLMAAQFEIRQKQLTSARKILGLAIGTAPKNKIFKTYINIELQLGNVDRCRTLYEKYLEWNAANCQAWVQFAELEQSVAEEDRARGIFELAIAQPVLDMPEVLWKAYIDFEISCGERERTRQLYERLLERTRHVKVWMSYAQFEEQPMPIEEDEEESPEEAAARAAAAEQGDEAPEVRAIRTRGVYERAYRSLRETAADQKEERVMLLEAWRAFEMRAGSSAEALEAVTKKMPRRVKRKREIVTEDGSSAGMEEYYDYIFPEEDSNAPNLKILEAAYKWKRQKMEASED